MAILGLLLLAAAIAAGVEVVLSNDVAVDAEIFGYTTAGATTTAFLLFGAMLAVVAILGLVLVAGGFRRARRRRRASRHEGREAERTTEALLEENNRLRGELAREQRMRDTMGGVAVPPGVGDVTHGDQITDAVRSADADYEPYPAEPDGRDDAGAARGRRSASRHARHG